MSRRRISWIISWSMQCLRILWSFPCLWSHRKCLLLGIHKSASLRCMLYWPLFHNPSPLSTPNSHWCWEWGLGPRSDSNLWLRQTTLLTTLSHQNLTSKLGSLSGSRCSWTSTLWCEFSLLLKYHTRAPALPRYLMWSWGKFEHQNIWLSRTNCSISVLYRMNCCKILSSL